MINNSVDQITQGDLQNLVDNKVLENRQIEYKRELSISNDAEKKEFLCDISSFANVFINQLNLFLIAGL